MSVPEETDADGVAVKYVGAALHCSVAIVAPGQYLHCAVLSHSLNVLLGHI